MLKESAMEKWFKFEMAKMNSGIVLKKRTLSELLREETPMTQAKDGSAYYFNKDALKRMDAALPEDMLSLKLPISFYTSLEVRGNAYIADRPSFSALKNVGELPKEAELVNGRYWISKILVRDMMRRWPTIIQFVRY